MKSIFKTNIDNKTGIVTLTGNRVTSRIIQFFEGKGYKVIVILN